MKILLLIGLAIIFVLFVAVMGVEVEKVEIIDGAATACADGNSSACDVANNHQDIVEWTDENGAVITLSPPTPIP